MSRFFYPDDRHRFRAWSVYGVLIKSVPVIAANGVALIIALITVFFTIRYR
jgi:uncharacterized protein with PQ loop repeat